MRSEWKQARLGAIAALNQENYSKKDGWKHVNYLDTGNITRGTIDEIVYIDLEKERLPSRARRKVFRNDIVYSTVRPNQEHYGIIKNPVPNMLVSTGFVTISANEEIDPFYLYYFLSQPHITGYLHALAEQRVSTYPAINVSDISDLIVSVPPLMTQKAISDTLSCLDSKIELNNKINENLEALAQAIFKSWFVDFEPFRDGEFIETEHGWIPTGWEITRLGKISQITSGKRPPSKVDLSTYQSNVPIVGASKIMGYTSEALYDEKILVIGRVGTHGVVQRFSSPCWPSDNTLIIKSDFYEFTYQSLRRIDYGSLNRGSTQPLITQTDLKNHIVVLPPLDVLTNFEVLISPLMNALHDNLHQNQILAALRDTLLPKLMSGEIEVPVD